MERPRPVLIAIVDPRKGSTCLIVIQTRDVFISQRELSILQLPDGVRCKQWFVLRASAHLGAFPDFVLGSDKGCAGLAAGSLKAERGRVGCCAIVRANECKLANSGLLCL